MTTERIRFHFDPICPWCYQAARWIWRLVDLGEVEADWAVFSLARANQGNEETRAKRHDRSEQALRIVIAVRERYGRAAVGTFYRQLGRRVHELGEPLEEIATIKGALADAGLDVMLCEQAMSDERTKAAFEAEHEDLVQRTRSFGVPTIALDGGDGPAIFGPVIAEVPSDEDAVQLLKHVCWLVRHDAFAELKRDRTPITDLESVRPRETGRTERG
jgi:protein-disulfide isomerase-like protein with CxxC motif